MTSKSKDFKMRSIGSSSLIESFRMSQTGSDSVSGMSDLGPEKEEALNDFHFMNIEFLRSSKTFRIHKFLLTQFSKYFRKNIYYSEVKMHTNAEEVKGELIEGEVSPGIVETFETFFIPYLYNEEVEISEENFMYVYQIASRWQFEGILKLCIEFPIKEESIVDFMNIFLQSRITEFPTPEELEKKMIAFCVEEFDSIEKVDSFQRLKNVHCMCRIVEETDHDVQESLTSWVNCNFQLFYEAKDIFHKILGILDLNEHNVISVYTVCKYLKMDVNECLAVIIEKFMKIEDEEFQKLNFGDLLVVVKRVDGQPNSKEIYEKKFEVIFGYHKVEAERFNSIVERLEELKSLIGILELGEKHEIDVSDISSLFHDPAVIKEGECRMTTILFFQSCLKKRAREQTEDRMSQLWDEIDFSKIDGHERLLSQEFLGKKVLTKILLPSSTKKRTTDQSIQHSTFFSYCMVPKITWGQAGNRAMIQSPTQVRMSSPNNGTSARSLEEFSFGGRGTENTISKIFLIKIDSVGGGGYEYVGISHAGRRKGNFNLCAYKGEFESYIISPSGELYVMNSEGSVLSNNTTTTSSGGWKNGDMIVLLIRDQMVSFFKNGVFGGTLKIDTMKSDKFFVIVSSGNGGGFSYRQEELNEGMISRFLEFRGNCMEQ